MARSIYHSPTLETILMVEDFVRENSGKYTKSQIWKNLPRKMMYQTFCVAFDYLVESNKMIVDLKNKKILWIWDSELVKKVLMRREAGKLAVEVTKVYGGKMFFRSRARRRGLRTKHRGPARKIFQKSKTTRRW